MWHDGGWCAPLPRADRDADGGAGPETVMGDGQHVSERSPSGEDGTEGSESSESTRWQTARRRRKGKDKSEGMDSRQGPGGRRHAGAADDGVVTTSQLCDDEAGDASVVLVALVREDADWLGQDFGGRIRLITERASECAVHGGVYEPHRDPYFQQVRAGLAARGRGGTLP